MAPALRPRPPRAPRPAPAAAAAAPPAGHLEVRLGGRLP